MEPLEFRQPEINPESLVYHRHHQGLLTERVPESSMMDSRRRQLDVTTYGGPHTQSHYPSRSHAQPPPESSHHEPSFLSRMKRASNERAVYHQPFLDNSHN